MSDVEHFATPSAGRTESALRLPFDGKVVLITGTSSGIGLHIAAQLSALGASLILFNRHVGKCEALIRKLLDADSPELSAIEEEVDISDLLDVREAFDALSRDHPDLKVDILINNAGCALGGGRRFWEQSMKDVNQVVGLNIMGGVHMTSEVLKRFMIPRGRGTILNITSAAALEPCYPNSGEAILSATKAFMESFTQSIRRETVGTGIRILALRPGRTNTELLTKQMGSGESRVDAEARARQQEIAQKRLEGLPTLRPDDVASAAVYMLLAPDSIAIQTMNITATGEHGVGCVDRIQ